MSNHILSIFVVIVVHPEGVGRIPFRINNVNVLGVCHKQKQGPIF